MYCHTCGLPLPPGSAYCPNCGVPQSQQPLSRSRSTLHPALIALLLLCLPPVGLILMWASSDWDDDVKWAISGLFFPPLWLRFLWRIPWLPYLVMGLTALALVRAAIVGGLSVVAAVTIIAVVTLFLVLIKPSPPRRQGTPGEEALVDLRREVGARLDACHDLIADIEATVVLDLLPAGAQPRRLYAQALETRAEAAQLLERASSFHELRRADECVSRALQELRAVKDGLPDSPSR